jgi:hypothetical protein
MPNPLAVLEIARKRIDHVLEIFSPGINSAVSYPHLSRQRPARLRILHVPDVWENIYFVQDATDVIVTSLLSIPGNSDTIEREHCG